MASPTSHVSIIAKSLIHSLVLLSAAQMVHAQNQAPEQSQYRMAVEKANTEPFKIDIQPVRQGVKPGNPTVIRLELRNAENQPVQARHSTIIEFKTQTPSQSDQVQTVQIAANTSSAEVTLTPQQVGLWKLNAREQNDRLKSGSNYLLVSPASQTAVSSQTGADAKKATKPAPAKKKIGAPKSPSSLPKGAWLPTPRLVMAAYVLQPETGGQSQPPRQDILLRVSGEGDGRIRADGVSAARVSVFLLVPRTTDVRVWLAVSQGQLDQPFVVIPAGQYSADAKWTSTTPIEQAKVTITNATPAIAGQELASATVSFVDPIVGIAFANQFSRINIVERGTLSVRFVDKNARPIAAHEPLTYRFSVNSAHISLTPISDQTKPGAIDFSTDIVPSAFGSVTIEAAVQGLPPIVSQPIQITGMLLLIFCILGGAAGGLVNHLDRKQKGLYASLLIACIVSLPITWLYVWVGLPKLNAAFLHSQLSAVMIAIIAGAGGAAGLKATAKLFGINLFTSLDDGSDGSGGSRSNAAAGAH
jgi:hypothetical protein